MSNDHVTVEKTNPAVALVTMRREHKLNALNDALISGLTQAAETLREDASIKAVVVTGGDRMFSAGADIATFENIEREPDVNRIRRMTQKGARMAEAWQSMPAVTIAAVEGGAVGGGLGLALACDWRVFSADAWAYVPEVRLGLNYGWGTLPRLAAFAGPGRAKWMSILSRRHSAQELVQWNLVEEIAEPGRATVAALALAQEVSTLPALAVQMIKQTVNAYSFALAKAASHSDMDNMLVCMGDPEGKAARASLTASLSDKAGRTGKEDHRG